MAAEEPEDREAAVERAREALEEHDEGRDVPVSDDETAVRRVQEALRRHDERNR
jgi:hypothetical protein